MNAPKPICQAGMAACLLLAMLLFPACPKPATCEPGAVTCACKDGNACDTGLACSNGTCTAAPACTPGTLDCACNSSGSCQPGLMCNNATCRARETPLQGDPGGPCYPNNTCNTGFQCASGTCQDPACPLGSIGCPCSAGDTCALASLSCQAGTCVTSGCMPGTAGCLCDNGSCGTGLQCQDNFCHGGNTLSLHVENAAVRACELVFEPGARAISQVAFPDTVVGEHLEKKGRVATAFTAKDDHALAASVMTLTLAGTQTATPQDAVPAVARCVNRLGQPVAAPGLQFR